jgi:glycosyltransferase involved in cell wall biosynthesis
MIDGFRPCVLIPAFDNALTLGKVVEGARAYLDHILVVDDGSGRETREQVAQLEQAGLIRGRRRHLNGGKGAAVVDGLRFAQELGFTHALQVDADGQHELDDIPRFLCVSQAHPEALVLGKPLFDETAPPSRRIARNISKFWVNLETGGEIIGDPLCGFRVYPVDATLAARPRARRMGHDPEVAVKIYWQGAPVLNLETRVRYLSREEGGVSHYRLVRDNIEMSWTHTRLCNQMLPRLLWRWARWGRR